MREPCINAYQSRLDILNNPKANEYSDPIENHHNINIGSKLHVDKTDETG